MKDLHRINRCQHSHTLYMAEIKSSTGSSATKEEEDGRPRVPKQTGPLFESLGLPCQDQDQDQDQSVSCVLRPVSCDAILISASNCAFRLASGLFYFG
jgi:hypothetical protein